MRELTKLRQRFILILMCAVGLVLTAALVISVFSSFSTQYDRIQKSLTSALTIEEGEQLRPHIGGPNAEEPSGYLLKPTEEPGDSPKPDGSKTSFDLVPVYVVDVDAATDEITNYGNAANMNEETLLLALGRIQSEENTSGVYFDLGLFYAQLQTEAGQTRIAFADATHILDNTTNLALVALLIWVLAMAAFFVISMMLSRLVLRPVKEAWTKQREFIADASHELKTPLTIILANNNIVMSHPEKPTADQQQWLQSTQEEAERMNDLVSDLLLLAQVEDEGDPLNTHGDGSLEDSGQTNAQQTEGSEADGAPTARDVDISSLVERTLLQFDVVFFERGISAESTIESGLHVKGNPEHLRRLTNILLDNASKYGNKGGTVEVRLAKGTEKPKVVELTVSNSGTLIPPEKIDRIFDRFFRGDAAHSTAVEGSGLGLALAREIVRELGGDIKVSSVPWQTESAAATPAADKATAEPSDLGATDEHAQLAQTTFTVTLPLA